MENFLEHAALTLILVGLGGGLWNRFQEDIFNGILGFGVGMLIASLIIYLLTK